MATSEMISSLTVEYSLLKENVLIQGEQISNLFVIQSNGSPLLWFGVLFVDSGIYLGAVIKFHIIIDPSYPNCRCPRLFVTPVPYHPLVDPETGELDTKKAFSDWSSLTFKLHQLLTFVKNIFYQPELYIQRIQEEALVSKGDLFSFPKHTVDCIETYESNRDEFDRLNNEFKQQCCRQLFERSELFDDDENYLQFEQWCPEIHEPIRKSVLSGKFTPTSLYAQYDKQNDSVSFIVGHHSG